MPETSTSSESEGPKAASVAEPTGDWRANLLFIADVSQKLAIPLLTVAATGLGFYFNHAANERAAKMNERAQIVAEENSELSLQNQREQSETSLRSTMFSELVGPLLSGKGDEEDDSKKAAQRLSLQAELLTLNFHEHFELGPALRYVDSLEGQTPETRDRLRRAARRVISRQLAPMMAAPGKNKEAGYFEIILSENVEESAEPSANLPRCYLTSKPPAADTSQPIKMTCSTEPPTKPLPVPEGSKPILVQVPSEPLIIPSPDGKDRVKLSLTAFDWDGGTVAVFAELQSPEPTPETGMLPRQTIEFTLSPYSLPFTDSTLLPSGNRFGMYIKSVDKYLVAEKPPLKRLFIVWFVWFPKAFVPPRERPFELDVKDVSAYKAESDGQAPDS